MSLPLRPGARDYLRMGSFQTRVRLQLAVEPGLGAVLEHDPVPPRIARAATREVVHGDPAQFLEQAAEPDLNARVVSADEDAANLGIERRGRRLEDVRLATLKIGIDQVHPAEWTEEHREADGRNELQPALVVPVKSSPYVFDEAALLRETRRGRRLRRVQRVRGSALAA